MTASALPVSVSGAYATAQERGAEVGEAEVAEPADRGLGGGFEARHAQLDGGADLLVAGRELGEAAPFVAEPVGEQARGPLPAGGQAGARDADREGQVAAGG